MERPIEIGSGNDPLNNATIHCASSAAGVAVDETNFPDPVFRGYVSDQVDADGDGFLSQDEIDARKQIDLSSSDYADLADVRGIEYLTEVTEMIIHGAAHLTAVDLSANTKIADLEITETGLTALDVSALPLGRLCCSNDALTALTLGSQPDLKTLYCYGNPGLAALDVRACPYLKDAALNGDVSAPDWGDLYEGPLGGTLFVDANAVIIAEGEFCGDNVIWTLKDGVLTISGTGPMADFDSADAQPWYGDRASIESVVIRDGVTNVGNNAFSVLDALEHVELGGTVASIGQSVFSQCAALRTVTVPANVAQIMQGAFQDCASLTDATILNPTAAFFGLVFDGCSALTVHGYAASTAETCAREAGVGFQLLVPAPEIILPDSLTAIEGEAFDGLGAEAVLIPKGVTGIVGNPFADSGVLYIYGFPGTAAEALTETYSQFTFITLNDVWYALLTD